MAESEPGSRKLGATRVGGIEKNSAWLSQRRLPCQASRELQQGNIIIQTYLPHSPQATLGAFQQQASVVGELTAFDIISHRVKGGQVLDLSVWPRSNSWNFSPTLTKHGPSQMLVLIFCGILKKVAQC